MDQHLAAPGTSLRLLLRLLVLAGAAVVGWLVLSGGPVQADAEHSHGAGTTATVSQTVHGSPVSQGTPGALHRTVAVVTAPLRNGPRGAADVVDRSTAPAPRPVRTAVRSVVTALEPALTTTTTHVADLVDGAAATVDAVVDPVLQATGLQGQPSGATPSTSHPAAVTPHVRHDRLQVEAPVLASTHALAATAVAGAHAALQAARGFGDTRIPGLPAGHELPIPASTGTVLLAGLLAGLALLLPTLLRRRAAFGRDLLPLGPAYPPGSSPG